MEKIQSVACVDKFGMELAKKLLPGPVTIIFPSTVHFFGSTIGVRVPNNRIALKILRRIHPLTCTSANLHGLPPPSSVREAMEQLGDKIDIYVDGGKCVHCGPSTVIRVEGKKIKLIRRGVIPFERVLECAREIKNS